jgi:hypothetical protein
MQSTYLQAMIAINAARIADAEILIASDKDHAMYMKEIGEIAFSIEAQRQVSRNRAKLRKAVEMQRAMKADLEHIFRTGRIEAKVALLGRHGIIVGSFGGRTSFEVESSLDNAIAVVVPRKADSRPADHKSFMKVA